MVAKFRWAGNEIIYAQASHKFRWVGGRSGIDNNYEQNTITHDIIRLCADDAYTLVIAEYALLVHFLIAGQHKIIDENKSRIKTGALWVTGKRIKKKRKHSP